VSAGGSWQGNTKAPGSGFRLVAVQAVLHDEANYVCYRGRQTKLTSLRQMGGQHFNFSSKSFDQEQTDVLSALRDQFQERYAASFAKSVNGFYSFHGPRREHLSSICVNGMVATRAMDAGYFGCGCYSTLNIEYAVRYAHGDFDEDGRVRAPPADGRYPVVMFACSVSMGYPITPSVDYGHTIGVPEGFSDYFGIPLRPGFDCHVICVSEATNWQATSRDECQYVEIVIEQESQMLPIAVLWFEEEA
jgi:hypothetical protein